MESISFTSLQLIVNSATPSKRLLDEVFKSRSENFTFSQTLHAIEVDIVDERFYWLYSNYGRAYPHRDIVIDIHTGQEQDNPRTVIQVEPTNQFFAVFDNNAQILYVSQKNKKSFISEFINKFDSESEIIIKNIYLIMICVASTILSAVTVVSWKSAFVIVFTIKM